VLRQTDLFGTVVREKNPAQIFFKKEHVLILAYYTDLFTNKTRKKRKIAKKFKTLVIFLEAFSDPFITAVEATSQSSPGTRAKVHKVEAAEEGLLPGESTEYAISQAHRPTPVPTTHPSFPPPTTRAMLRFLPKIIFLEINRVNNIIT
jgi:hypothetical protein